VNYGVAYHTLIREILKMTAVLDMVPCSLVEVVYTDVSEVRTTSIIRAFKTAVTFFLATSGTKMSLVLYYLQFNAVNHTVMVAYGLLNPASATCLVSDASSLTASQLNPNRAIVLV
jgi:hypothetical protein